MSSIKSYIFTSEPQAQAYNELIRFCCAVAAKFILVVRDPQIVPNEKIRLRLAELHEYLIAAVLSNEWPGTRLRLHKATIHWFRVESAVDASLRDGVTHLFQWLHPSLPEDLCMLREDGRVLLATTSHEGDAFMFLTDDEYKLLSERAPTTAALLRLEGLASEYAERVWSHAPEERTRLEST